jgi:hypothetical protein
MYSLRHIVGFTLCCAFICGSSIAVTGERQFTPRTAHASWTDLLNASPKERSVIDRVGFQSPLDDQSAPIPLSGNRNEAPRRLSAPVDEAAAAWLAVTRDFLGLADDNTTIPPDPAGAAGPNHLMVMANTEVRIMSRDGEQTGSTVPLETFWQPSGSINTYFSRMLYDQSASRWLAVCADSWASAESAILFAISDTDDPSGGWSFYSFEADPADINAASSPRIGYNGTWIAIAANMHLISDGSLIGAVMWVIDKSTALAGGTLTTTYFAPGFDQVGSAHGRTLQPCQTFGSSSTLHIIDNSGYYNTSTFVNLLRCSQITGTAESPVWSVQPNSYYPASGLFEAPDVFEWFQIDAAQPGTSARIDTYAPYIQSAVYRDGSVWAVHSAGLDQGSPVRTGAFWYQLDPTSLPEPVVQSGVVDGGYDIHYYYPTLAVNAAADVMIGFTRSDAAHYAEAAFTGRRATDPAGTMDAVTTLKAGEDSYAKTFSAAYVRWGRSSTTVVDPTDDMSFWTLQQYAAEDVGPSTDDDRWGLWWGFMCHPDAADTDGDAIPDACDQCPGGDDAADADLDGVADACDICPDFDDLVDSDADSVPDGCDLCEGYDDGSDSDLDGVPDGCDICAGYDDGTDSDLDGVPDGCDACEGYDDALDSDEDGVPDDCDICAGHDDGEDPDGDLWPSGCDNCPYTSNPNQTDSDEDGTGDACEICCGEYDSEGRTGNVDFDPDNFKDISDILMLARYSLQGGAIPPCLAEANTDGDPECFTDISDILRLARYALLGGEAPDYCRPECE